MVLELVHAGGREQDGRIPAGDEDIAGFAGVAFGFKKGEIFLTDFVGFHGSRLAQPALNSQ
jgi:hypothetical protein